MEVLVVPVDVSHPGGPEVVRKTASRPVERQRLLREAEVLEAAAARGVQGLATVVGRPRPEDDEPCLITSAVAGPSLAVAAPLPVLEVAGVAAEVARLLAGLHETGLVHGSVEPGHVVLDGTGGAILVGLGNGGPAGAPSPDPAAGGLDPAADVAGWGALVSHLLDWSATTDDEPLVALRRKLVTGPARRGGRRPPPPRPDHDERRVLAALADQAQDPDPARRPSARSLATAISHRLPAARMPGAVALAPPAAVTGGLLDRLAAHVTTGGPPAGSTLPPEPAGSTLPPEPAGSTLPPEPAGSTLPPEPAGSTPGAAAAMPAQPADSRTRARARRAGPDRRGAGRSAGPAAAGRPVLPSARWQLTRAAPVTGPGEAPSDRPQTARRRGRLMGARQPQWVLAAAVVAMAVVGAPAAVARLRTTDRPASTGRPAPPGRGCPVVVPPAADVDGDGCEEPVRWVDGVLQAGTARFALGGPGDAWSVGDWDCDGRRTPALLHDGTLAVFDDWPGPGAELRGRPVAAVAGAAGLTVVPGPSGCDRPSLARPGAADVVVDARRAP